MFNPSFIRSLSDLKRAIMRLFTTQRAIQFSVAQIEKGLQYPQTNTRVSGLPLYLYFEFDSHLSDKMSCFGCHRE